VILGSGGYLGRELASELAGQISGGGLSCVRGIGDLEAGSGAPADIVVNCVGYYGSDADRLRTANIDHVREVALYARRKSAEVLHVSSSAVFDAMRSGLLDETTAPAAVTAYGKSKLAGERELLNTLPSARIARPAKVFGGSDPRERLHALVRHVIAGRPLPIPARPQLWANFVWVRELARVLASEVLRPRSRQIIHLASPVPWPVFISFLEEATRGHVRRTPRALEVILSGAVPVAERVHFIRRSRWVERSIEVWDRQAFVDSDHVLTAESVLAGLGEVVGTVNS